MSLLPSVNIKDIVDLIKKGSHIEAEERIIGLREAALDLQERNIELTEENKHLKESLRIMYQLKWDKRGWYYLDIEGEQGHPYCQLCYDKGSKLIRLQDNSPKTWTCYSCGHTFNKTGKQIQG